MGVARRCPASGPLRSVSGAGEEGRETKGNSMRKIRYVQVGAIMAALAWYVASALPASAISRPPDPADNAVGGAVTAPAQLAVVHAQTPTWTYLLIAAAAVAATLAVVSVIARLRRGSEKLA